MDLYMNLKLNIMVMRKIYLFIAACFMCMAAGAQQTMPPAFSTSDSPAWYWVVFNNGNWALADQGAGNLVRTASRSSVPAQKWMLEGVADNFRMKNQAGNYIAWNGTAYTTSATAGVPLKLVKSGVSGCWEIARADGTLTMNMHQGAGSGKEIREYNVGDSGNPLKFVQAGAVYPKFSDGGAEHWYFVQFSREGRTLLDQGREQLCVTAEVDPVDGQLWKFVGTKEDFQLVSKLGNYAYVSGTGNAARLKTQATAPAQGFSMAESGSTQYPVALEIRAKGLTGNNVYMNQWSDMRVGQEIGFWAHTDQNNALNAVDVDNMTYAEYKVEGVARFTPENDLTLWYDQPATTTDAQNKWMEYSLPIGNGQFGACLFGGVYKDEIQFNEKTLWTGGPNDMGGYGGYKNFGSVFVENLTDDFSFGSSAPVKDYVRFLDIEAATGGVDFTDAAGTTSYTRRYVSSYPDKVVAARYVAKGEKKLSLRFSVVPGEGISASDVTYADGYASFGGKLTTVSYNARFRVVPVGTDAAMTADENGITVTGADEILLVLAGATDYDASQKSFVSGTAGLPTLVKARVDAAAEKGWEAIYSDHVSDFRSLMGRVNFRLDGAVSAVPTNVLINNYNTASKNVTGKEPEVLFLEQLYFAYGRYLMIGSSRGVDVPSNLQGIWNNVANAPWNSDIHSNINVQMNYWPAEPTNLSELHLPFLNYIITMAAGDNWQRCAQRGGQNVGWSCYTENNIFGGMSTWGSNYYIANAWYCSHLWQHYRYTLDKDFLARAFPAMWSAAQFWMARMVKDRVVMDGTYVCPDEYSPEQNRHPKEDATAHSQQLVMSLFASVRKAIDVLGAEAAGLGAEDVTRLDDYLEHSDTGLATEEYTGEWGNVDGVKTGDILLREWKYATYDMADERQHRHLSHLMCLYPLGQVTASSPYFEPAVTSLRLRGDEATGWSMGWKANLWARALDGDHAHIILHNALKHSTSYGTNQYAGGIYYNLFDSHAPFQIDGNFGMCSGIAEMLMQSHSDTIHVLPALPSVWQKGSVTGLKAVGDFTVDVAWENGNAVCVKVVSNQGQPLVVRCAGIGSKKVYVNGVEVAAVVIDENTVGIPLRKGESAEVNFNETATAIEPVAGEGNLDVCVSGRTVSIGGADVASVKVCDIAGRTLLITADSSFTLDKNCGSVVLLQVTEKSGKVSACKVAL